MKSGILTHLAVADAPTETLYGLVADVTRWPVLFGPTIHVKHLGHNGNEERFRLWALVNGDVKTWTSRRTLDPGARRISFEQEESQPPIGSMSGSWTFRPAAGDRTEIVLEHEFTAAGDDHVLDTLTTAVDRNSEEELAALAKIAGLGHSPEELVYSFSDELELSGTAQDAYEFIARAELWPDSLPHVSKLVLREDEPGVQHMDMDTVTVDGSTHSTRSVRLCFPHEQVVYKQQVPPALLTGHSGSWTFTPRTGGGTLATAEHTVAIDPHAIPGVLGPQATLADARNYLRDGLGGNGRATLSRLSAHISAPEPAEHGTATAG